MCSIHRCTLFWVWLENIHVTGTKSYRLKFNEKVSPSSSFFSLALVLYYGIMVVTRGMFMRI